MKYFILIFVLLQLNYSNVHGVRSEEDEEGTLLCPNFCQCDSYNNWNRATCRAKRLINANVDIPRSVEILDLSYNDITQLDENCFAAYHYIVNLSVSYNSIQTIYLNAFAGLHRVLTIDLSYNRLEAIDERIVEMNRKLHTLNLEGNKFPLLANKPFIRSPTLRVLNLRNSQIGYLTSAMFEGVPQLLELDVSQNLMISMNPVALNMLHQLGRIDLDENPWNCDKALMKVVQSLGRRNVNVSLIDCTYGQQTAYDGQDDAATLMGSQKFEKIVLPGASDSAASEEPKVIRGWHRPRPEDDFDADDDEGAGGENSDGLDDWSETKLFLGYPPLTEVCNGTQQRLCQRYRQYLLHASDMLSKRLPGEAPGLTRATGPTYSQNDLYIVFAFGATVGVSLVVCIWSCSLACKKPFKKRHSHVHLPGDATPNEAPPRPPRARPPPPPPTRRQRRSAPPHPIPVEPLAAQPYSRDLVRASAPSGFLTGLFGRPARHQYYRTINENTAILIRRLSRSNLFNPRERERERQRNRDSPSESPDPRDENAGDHLIVIVPSQGSHSQEERPRPSRSETPPPSYVDVVDSTEELHRK